jgi:serine/threonine-protein phosphatase 2A regulatory subunit A
MSQHGGNQLPPGTNDDLETEGAHASPAPHPQPDPLVPGGTTLVPGTAPSLALARSLPLPTDALPTVSALDLFTAQMSSPYSSEARVDAMRRLSVVAAAMGTDGTLSTLLPYLSTHVATNEDEEDEVLLLLADQLGNLVPGLVPGSKALPVLPLLERIASVEETVVREKAVESLNKIVPCLSYRWDEVGAAGDGEADAVMADADGADGEPSQSASSSSSHHPSQTPALLLSMAKRLSGADWFTAKVSAAGILPAIYRYFTSLQTAQIAAGVDPDGNNADAAASESDAQPKPADAHRELRALYKELAADEAPMVRRSAARHLAAFVEAVAALPKTAQELSASPNSPNATNPPTIPPDVRRIVLDELVPVYQTLGTDEQDSVRLLAVSASGSVGYALGVDPELTSELVFPVVRGGCQDLSWRVRNHLSKEFATVAASLGFTAPEYESLQVEIFRLFSSLLQDNEAEVRSVAVDAVARMAQLGGPDLFQAHITPALPILAEDPVMEVRSKLAHAIMDCCDETTCAILTDRVVLQDFKPLLENFLNDEFAEVQLRVLTKLSRVSHLLARMDTVVGSILAMAKATNWRVRDAVSRLLPHLAEARGISFFEDHLLELWMKLLQDQVAEVRFGCISGMPKLLSVAGPEWVQKEILPRYLTLYEGSSSYLTRITVIRSFAELVHDGGANGHSLLEDVLNLILKGLEDKVANVRMVAAQGLAKILAEGGKDAGEAMWDAKVQPALSARVMEDDDDDCKFFAQIALDACA